MEILREIAFILKPFALFHLSQRTCRFHHSTASTWPAESSEDLPSSSTENLKSERIIWGKSAGKFRSSFIKLLSVKLSRSLGQETWVPFIPILFIYILACCRPFPHDMPFVKHKNILVTKESETFALTVFRLDLLVESNNIYFGIKSQNARSSLN